MSKIVVKEELKDEYIKQLSIEDIFFVSFAESGAMGSAGCVEIFSLEEDKIIIRTGNYVYENLNINELADKFPPLNKIHYDNDIENWKCEYMGAGNHLLIRNDVYHNFMCRVDPSRFQVLCATIPDSPLKKAQNLVKSIINPSPLDSMNLYAKYMPCAIETLKSI